MAGAGYKNFAPGEVLTSSDVDLYLMEQSVMVFAGTAARGTTLTSPAEGMFSYRTDADALEVYNGTAWVPAAQAAGAATVTNRNLLYNGAMQVSQRGTSTTGITTSAYYTADRWAFVPSSMGTWTNDIQNDAPTGTGFRRSFRVLCTTADAAPAASDFCFVSQPLEGQDLQRIAKGTSSAKTLTFSFWVKTNVTGTYIVECLDNDNNRICSLQYTIAAGDSGNWVRRTLTFPADTTGAFDNDNASSLGIRWWLGAGTDYTSGSLQNTWGTLVQNKRAVGQVNVAAATNNYWQITGVQLETGDVATDFEFKSFGQELRECQRYYQEYGGQDVYVYFATGRVQSSTRGDFIVPLITQMRANPSVSFSSAGHFLVNDAGDQTVTAITLIRPTTQQLGEIQATVASGLTTGRGCFLISNNTTAARIRVSAEL